MRRSALQNIVPNAFGDHEKCSKTWCGYIRNPDTYKHMSFPNVKDLCEKIFQQDLEAVFSVFANSAENITRVGFTKDIESFNNMVAAKKKKTMPLFCIRKSENSCLLCGSTTTLAMVM